MRARSDRPMPPLRPDASAAELGLLGTLDEIGRIAVASSDLGEIGRRATALIKQALGLAYVGLVLVDHGRGVVQQLADASDLGRTLPVGYTLPLTSAIVGRSAREARTVLVNDVSRDPDYVETIPGVVTTLAVPVKTEGVVIAVLVCESREPHALDEHVLLMEVVAHRLGVAFENAELFRDHELALRRVHRQADELDALNEIGRIATEPLELRPTLQAITDALARRFGWEFVACVSVDVAAGRFTCEALTSQVPTLIEVGYSRELGSGVVGHVAQTGTPMVIDDVQLHDNYVETLPGTRSEICVPVKYGGEIVAVINVESMHKAAFADQLTMLETVAEHVSATIANARLYERLRRRARELEMLSEASRLASAPGAVGDVLGAVVEYVRVQLGLTLVAVLLLDERGEQLELTAIAANAPVGVKCGLRVHRAAGVLGRALATGEPQLVPDVLADPDYVSMSDAVVAELVIPIRSGDELLGAVDLNASSAAAFDPEAVLVLRTLVDQISGAVRLATVNRRLEQVNRVLTDLFSRYVAPDLAGHLLKDPERFRNRGERRDASVLFADIRGFTRISQRLGPEGVLALLNEYYEAMGEAIFAQRGSVNQILGDGLMAVFGVPEQLDDHAGAALRAASAMQVAADRLSPRWQEIAGEALRIVIVVNSGEVVAGSLGDPRHMEFTVLGDVVNVAARLEAEAKLRDARILVTAAVLAAAGERPACTALGDVDLRGREGPVQVFRIE